MSRFSVLLSTTALVVAIAAMSAGGSGIRDAVAPDLTDEVEALVESSVLREYAGLGRTPIPPPVVVAGAIGAATGIPGSGPAYAGAPFMEIPPVPGGYTPLTDLDALYGVYGSGAPAAPAHAEPPMVDAPPAMVAWLTPPLDAK